MIKVKSLVKRFDNQIVLDGVDLDVAEGELVVVIGESGSGKSVLLQHLIGLIKPTSGSVEIGGQDITRLKEKDLLKIRKDIGYLFQEGALYDFMTVYENVAFPLKEHTKFKSQEIRNKVNRILALVGLQSAGDKYPRELSGGMKKRAALARSVILDSKILFCDEPTSGLDPIKSKDISELIKAIVAKLNCTTVVTSHDIHNSFLIADRIALIQEGKILVRGTPDELRKSEHSYVNEFLS